MVEMENAIHGEADAPHAPLEPELVRVWAATSWRAFPMLRFTR